MPECGFHEGVLAPWCILLLKRELDLSRLQSTCRYTLIPITLSSPDQTFRLWGASIDRESAKRLPELGMYDLGALRKAYSKSFVAV